MDPECKQPQFTDIFPGLPQASTLDTQIHLDLSRFVAPPQYINSTNISRIIKIFMCEIGILLIAVRESSLSCRDSRQNGLPDTLGFSLTLSRCLLPMRGFCFSRLALEEIFHAHDGHFPAEDCYASVETMPTAYKVMNTLLHSVK